MSIAIILYDDNLRYSHRFTVYVCRENVNDKRMIILECVKSNTLQSIVFF